MYQREIKVSPSYASVFPVCFPMVTLTDALLEQYSHGSFAIDHIIILKLHIMENVLQSGSNPLGVRIRPGVQLLVPWSIVY